MNAIGLLRNDHHRISGLLERIANRLDPETGQTPNRQLEELVRAVRSHITMIREYLYPQLEQFDNSRPLITVNERTSMRVDELLNELESDQNREQSWGARLTALRNAWQLHVEQAEQTLLPEAERLLGPTKLQQLLYDMDAIRTRQSEMDSAIYPASRLGPKT